jgi:hypothetical protein
MVEPTLDLRQNNAKEKETNKELPNEDSKHGKLSKGEIFLSWEASEYVVYKKTVGWYIGFGILLAFLLFTAFIMQSLLTGIVFLLGGILIFVHSERPAKTISYDIRSSGVHMGKEFYLFRELEAFNVVERGDGVYMLLKSKRLLLPLIHIPLGDVDHEEVVRVMSEKIPQDPDFVEPLADVIAHWAGF